MQLAAKRAAERMAYEDSLLGKERENVLREAREDASIEEKAFESGFALTPAPALKRVEEAGQESNQTNAYDPNVFYFAPGKEGAPEVEKPLEEFAPKAEGTPSQLPPKKQSSSQVLEITIPSDSELDLYPEGGLSPETWDLIRYALALSREAVREVKEKKYKKQENLLSQEGGEKTYSFPMEHPEVRK